ncbi:MAG: class I SAM-dependent DNA methyltransferase [Sulfurimonas sp.]|nr:class I SAM-dependent DNA methyltransferase [Sulfurimonas sp.]
MTITQIETNITKLLKNFTQDTFIFEFLLAYGEPKSTITLLKKGDLNQLESKGEVLLRKKVFFKEAHEHLHGTIDTLKNDIGKSKQKPRFIIVNDYKTFLAYDTKTADTLDIDFKEIVKHYDFFLPLAGMEKSTHIDENPADVKASNQLAKLYDEILKNNPTKTHEEVHALNVFLTRLLFCYFAEDSNIFEDNVFTDSIASHTQVDGSDVGSYLERLFDVFNTDEKDREANLPEYLKVFPYVNGGLFRDKHPLPEFTTKSRNILIDIGGLDWSEINPDIFGSMIQAVVTPEHRGDMGMHYTSVPNIMKVMQPLFLDELHEEFDKVKTSKKKLQELINRISNLKIFDPACGSGNFLIIAYKELRRLEMKILKAIDDLSPQRSFAFSEIKLTQFYGIELDDFAHEVAILSLWLAEHQMNLEFYKAFGRTSPSLPLQDGGNIVYGNATRIDWGSVCPKVTGDEIYILGNPPYLGARLQDKTQKEDMKIVFNGIKGYNNLDYIACWFYKGANYIKNTDAKCALVSTNSISQGEQVGILWTHILNKNIEIDFAYKSFKWQNNAKGNAKVIVAIIGLRNISNNSKYLYQSNIKQEVGNINAYLVNSKNIFIKKSSKAISEISKMSFGSMPNDGGNLLLSSMEKTAIVNEYPNAIELFKKFVGSQEFIRGEEKYCLWITDDLVELSNSIPPIKDRIEKCKHHRESSSREATRKLAFTPYQFGEVRHQNTASIIVPRHSSENRDYIPMGFYPSEINIVIADSAQAIYNAELWLFGLVTSKMHMVWMRTLAGKLKNDFRYSATLVYNTYPFPNITDKQKEEIADLVFNILDEREQHSEKTLAQLYDPNKMPQDLKEAHHQLDLAIEKCYRNKPFENDEERLEYLFKLYEEMIKAEGK